MAPPLSETAPKLPPVQQEQEMVLRTDHEVSPAAGEMPLANFSEAIDRIGLGPFQTRLMIMCGMVSRVTTVVQCCSRFICLHFPPIPPLPGFFGAHGDAA